MADGPFLNQTGLVRVWDKVLNNTSRIYVGNDSIDDVISIHITLTDSKSVPGSTKLNIGGYTYSKV